MRVQLSELQTQRDLAEKRLRDLRRAQRAPRRQSQNKRPREDLLPKKNSSESSILSSVVSAATKLPEARSDRSGSEDAKRVRVLVLQRVDVCLAQEDVWDVDGTLEQGQATDAGLQRDGTGFWSSESSV